MKKKKICVITSSRADFGLLKELMLKLNKLFDLKLVVTGSHLSRKFGYTKNEVIKNKIPIYKSVKIFDKPSHKKFNETYILNTISKTIKKFDKIFKKINPEIIIILGDRYEIFACAISATVNRKLIAHIHGGETTSNALDDSFRHSITQMSQIHFVAAKKYYNRVIQLGKNPSNVHLVGGLGPSNIRKIKIKSKKYLSSKITPQINKKYALLLYHPETKLKDYGLNGLKNTLEIFNKIDDLFLVIIYPNADTYNDKMIKTILENKTSKIKIIKSSSYIDFISLLKYSEFIIGNSSSGIIEAPSLKVPTINIGNRQHGRLRANSILDIGYSKSSILEAIKKARSLKFKRKIKNTENPYYHGDTVKKIIKVLKKNTSYEAIDKTEFFSLKLN